MAQSKTAVQRMDGGQTDKKTNVTCKIVVGGVYVDHDFFSYVGFFAVQ